jgi:hypothetical protein
LSSEGTQGGPPGHSVCRGTGLGVLCVPSLANVPWSGRLKLEWGGRLLGVLPADATQNKGKQSPIATHSNMPIPSCMLRATCNTLYTRSGNTQHAAWSVQPAACISPLQRAVTVRQHVAFLTQAEKTKKRNERRRTSLHPSLTDADDLLAQARSHLQPVPTCSPFPLAARSHLQPVPTYSPFPLTAPAHTRLSSAVSAADCCESLLRIRVRLRACHSLTELRAYGCALRCGAVVSPQAMQIHASLAAADDMLSSKKKAGA